MKWISVKDKMPTERGSYLLYSRKQDVCVGPIPWLPTADGKDGMWCDLFATPEVGHSYAPEPKGPISHWMPWTGPEE